MEGIPQNKTEKIMPKIILHFLRHSIKEKNTEKSDKDIPLTAEGRELAAEKFEKPLDMRYAHIVGAPSIRTRETAAVAATKNPKTNPEDLGAGKVRIDERLMVRSNRNSEYIKQFNKEDKEGKGMTFLVHKSDAVAEEKGDATSATYSKMAANIAEIIYRNFEVASRGASVLEQNDNSENNYHDFERVLVTHAFAQESFLLKLVEKMKGAAARDELLSVISENAFDVTEGFDTTLAKEDGEIRIRITYKKGDYVFDEIVPSGMIKEIADEGDENEKN